MATLSPYHLLEAALARFGVQVTVQPGAGEGGVVDGVFTLVSTPTTEVGPGSGLPALIAAQGHPVLLLRAADVARLAIAQDTAFFVGGVTYSAIRLLPTGAGGTIIMLREEAAS